ncbi:MAG: hypothetical protein ACREML_14605 [Vulcanimicrobiaceae bacterium]
MPARIADGGAANVDTGAVADGAPGPEYGSPWLGALGGVVLIDTGGIELGGAGTVDGAADAVAAAAFETALESSLTSCSVVETTELT